MPISAKPLAEQMRPQSLDDVIGQDKILGSNGFLSKMISSHTLTNIILWGPPGTGKTTLARIIARESGAEFIELSAVSSGKKDVENVIANARINWNGDKNPSLLANQSASPKRTILFVDEIHRFNKAQQDAFLPHVESGLITLIGATTENPSFEVIAPLLSRSHVVILESLTHESIVKIIRASLKKLNKSSLATPKSIELLAQLADGDARKALGYLELLLSQKTKITLELITKTLPKSLPRYDKKGDAHYDVISAFIKSMRGGDVPATTYYLARMIQAGEDPKFIARRMIIFASEDIGLAGNGALGLAVAAFDAVTKVGLPEAEYNLYHAAIALARSQKSREITDIMGQAKQLAGKFPNAKIPLHVRNASTELMKQLGYAKDYKWQPGFKHQEGFLPENVKFDE